MKVRRLIAMIIMIASVLFLTHFFLRPVGYVFSGEFLASRFRLQSSMGGDSYQVGINKMLLASMIISAIAVPMVLVVRWLADRSNRYDKWSFVIFSSITLIFPLSCLAIAFHGLLQYIWAMGMTVRRGYGIVFCLVELIALCGLWLWMTGFIRKENNIPKKTEL